MVNEVLISAPLALSMVLCAALGVFVWLRSRLRVRLLFVIAVLMIAFLAATFWLELATTSLQEKLFWNDLEYIVNVALPPMFLLFTLIFLGRSTPNRPRVLLLFIYPALTLLLLWTNDIHHLFYSQVWLMGDGWYDTFGLTYGIGFILHAVYSLSLLLASVALLSSAYLRSSRMHRKQVRLMLVASLIPILSLGVGFLNWDPLSLTYVFVIGFTTSAVLIFLGTFMYELFDVVPLALESIVEAVDDCIIVIDMTGRVVFANRNVLDQAGIDSSAVYARPLNTLSPELTEEMVGEAARGVRTEVHMGRDPDKRTYILKVTPIMDREGAVTSLLLTLRDITEERSISRSLEIANLKLNLLSSITRHDILNQVTVVRGTGDLLASRDLDDEVVKRYGQRVVDAATIIERQFTFARDYQDLGVKTPEWQNARAVFERAVALGLAGDLIVLDGLEGVEILADPLLDRVFSILLDNTKRHGVKATTVTTWCEIRGDDLAITYEDDGEGIPDQDKESIFELGYGRSGGLGLFLARQILDVNGASIREVGVPGENARFEIIFPAGRWRKSDRGNNTQGRTA